MEKSKYLGGAGKKNYFEGWYFKQVSASGEVLSLIPGISFASNDPHCFIQVIQSKKKKPYYIRYDIEEFSYKENEFMIRIGKNIFGEKGIHLEIEDKLLNLKGDLKFSKLKKLKKTLYAPTIMGPFSYLKHMECNHEIVSLYHEVNGILKEGKKKLDFNLSTGYIEKDFGTSFPKEYLWLQSNHPISKKNMTFFLSVATIPLKVLSFEGLIGTIVTDEKTWRFASYYGGRKIKEKRNKKQVEIVIKQGSEKLFVYFNTKNALPLKSPKFGEMENSILETVDGEVKIILYSKDKKILEETFLHAGIEYVRI